MNLKIDCKNFYNILLVLTKYVFPYTTCNSIFLSGANAITKFYILLKKVEKLKIKPRKMHWPQYYVPDKCT